MTLKDKFSTTKIQDKFLSYWRKYYQKNGYWPSMKQAAKDLGYSSTSSVQTHLLLLEKKGLMKRQKGRYWYVGGDLSGK